MTDRQGPLLSPEYFSSVFEPLQGHRIGFLPMPGNIGDRLIERGTLQLFEHFGIEYRMLDPAAVAQFYTGHSIDKVVISGGGNLGQQYPEPYALRQQVLKLGLPVVVLPQSMLQCDEDLDAYERIYAREHYTASLDPRFELAPDPALAVSCRYRFAPPAHELGLFLRQNQEALFADDERSVIDPVAICATVSAYLELASQFAHVITDRLHFAVAALLTGNEATLLPNRYHKNIGMFESWLAELGCRWKENLDGLEYSPESAQAYLFETGRLNMQTLSIPGHCQVAIARDCKTVSLDGGALEFQRTDGNGPPEDGSTRHRQVIGGGTAQAWKLAVEGASLAAVCQRLESGHDKPDSTARKAWQFNAHRTFEIMFRLLHGEKMIDVVDPGSGRHVGQDDCLLTIHPAVIEGDAIRYEGTLYDPAVDTSAQIWFETGSEHADYLSHRADSCVLAVLYRCMEQGKNLWVRGAPMSFELVQNLEQYQSIWHCWFPKLSRITVYGAVEPRGAAENHRALGCFSGGLDSAHTLFRRQDEGFPDNRWSLNAVLMIHGFDIRYEDNRTWQQALDRASKIISLTTVERIQLKTNVRDLNERWPNAHGLVAAACLTLFSRGFGIGLIPGTFAYNMLTPWGSNPLSDRFMGSDRFIIENDSADRNRFEKIQGLMANPDAIKHLRVCWQEGTRVTNCGRCIKCVMTGLMAITAGADASFLSEGFSDEAACEALDMPDIARADWLDAQLLFKQASKRGITAPWVAALAKLRPS